jgi:hypothetical protein
MKIGATVQHQHYKDNLGVACILTMESLSCHQNGSSIQQVAAHLRNEETNEAVEMVRAYPVLITMEDDELGYNPLHHALFNKAPFHVISNFVAHWLLFEDLHSLTEMQLVHLACMHNAPFDVIHYLSSLFPGSLTTKNKKGYTPFMIALWNKVDEDIIQLLNYSNFDAIGDFNGGNYGAQSSIIKEYFGDAFDIDSEMADEFVIDSKMAIFRVEHKDPTLNCIMIGDRFHFIHPKESDGSFDASRYERAVMDVLDAVQMHPHLKELILAVDDPNSILWRDGNARNALIAVIRNLPSTTAISIRTSIPRLVMVGEMMQHCPQLKFLSICYYGCGYGGHGIRKLVEYLNNCPVLESVQFYNVPLYSRDAILLYHHLIKNKKLVRSILMVGTQMDNFLASRLVSIFEDNPVCENLEFMCLFDCDRPHASRQQWQEDIDLQLEEFCHVNHTRKSVSDFMNIIKSRETCSNGRNEELQFITDIMDANEKDSEDEYDQICHPDHLYALIQSNPDYIQRCVDLGREYRASNKRQKLN